MPNEIGVLEQIADCYATFAADEAMGSSEIYERLPRTVARSTDVLEFLATLPAEKRQPIAFLLLSAIYLECPVANASLLRSSVGSMSQFVNCCFLTRRRSTSQRAARSCFRYWFDCLSR
jgi:hypothetical protein